MLRKILKIFEKKLAEWHKYLKNLDLLLVCILKMSYY